MEGFFNYEKSLEGKVITRVPARARGLLYHQNAKGYPAMVSGDGWVKGELLEFADYDNVLTLCDRIEGFLGPGNPGNEYERRATAVEPEDGGKCSAWVYWYARQDLCSTDNPAAPVSSGDWREFMKK